MTEMHICIQYLKTKVNSVSTYKLIFVACLFYPLLNGFSFFQLHICHDKGNIQICQ